MNQCHSCFLWRPISLLLIASVAGGADAAQLEEVLGDLVAGLKGGRVDDRVHVALRELGRAPATAADDGVPVGGAGGHEGLAVVGAVHAAHGPYLAQHLERAVHGGKAELRAALARGVEDLERAQARAGFGDGVDHRAPLAREAQAALGEASGDGVGVEGHKPSVS